MTIAAERARDAFTSPLASQLERFLTLKRAMGYRYRDESRLVRELDQFLTTRLPTDDPVLTMEVARAYVARRGRESDSTRAHRLTIVREVSRFLRLEDARTGVPGPRFLGIVRRTFVPRVLNREEGRRFLQACGQLAPDRRSPMRGAVLGTALRLLYLNRIAPRRSPAVDTRRCRSRRGCLADSPHQVWQVTRGPRGSGPGPPSWTVSGRRT